ncbi:MAG: nuclear transport factor 2 family protein [Pseudomonadota bacterium]
MSLQPEQHTELLRAAYVAFNARDIEGALALMTVDVTWPMAFKGGVVRGHEEIRAYWTEQWSEIDPNVEPVAFHPRGGGHVEVDVHQVVRSLAGAVLADEHVSHRFTLENGLIRAMEVGAPPAA